MWGRYGLERGDDEDDEDDDDDDYDDYGDDGAAVVDIVVVVFDVVENVDADLMMEMLSSLVLLFARFGPKSGRHKATLFSWAFYLIWHRNNQPINQ